MSYPKRGISVDIGNEKIKIAEYIKNKDKVKIKNAIFLDTPENSVNDGQITDVALISECIASALKENRIKNKNVIFSVSSSKVITREVEMPDLPKKKLDTLIQMNAEEYFPVNLSEYTLDYTIVEKMISGEEHQVRINIIAALTVLLESYVELADSIGLRIAGIDYSGNSIVNFAKHIQEERTYMLLDLGSESTMVTIMNGGVVKFNRNLVYGTKVICNSIQNHFGVEYKEAMAISMEQELLNNSPEGNDYLSSDVSAALNQILNGVSRLVDYYVSRNKDGIDRIILVGGGTNIKGMSSYVDSYFNIKTKVLGSEDILINGPVEFENNKVFYANAMGAIFSEINLLPKSILDKGRNRASGRLRVEVGLLLLLLASVAMYLPYMQLKSLEDERDNILIELDQKRAVEPILASYNQKMEELTFYRTIEDVSSSTTEVLVDVLEVFEKEMPSAVDFLTLNNSETSILIAGASQDKLNVVSLITALKAMELDGERIFGRVFIPGISSVASETSEDAVVDDEESYYSFTVVCEYKSGGEE